MMTHRRPARLVLAALIVSATSVLLGTCRQQETPEVPEKPTLVVENPELRLRLNDVPDDFVVVSNAGDELILGLSSGAGDGEISFANRVPEEGQNLPAAAEDHQSFIAAREGGEALGGQELVSQLGTMFYSRGRYVADGAEIEETVIFALHPDADRITTVTYRYPAGDDSSVRVQQLFDVLAVIEGID